MGVEGAEPGDLLVVDILDIGAFDNSLWGFNGFFSKQNGGGFLTEHFPEAQKSIWDFKGMFTSSRHVPGVEFAGLIHPGLIGCLPSKGMLLEWNTREKHSTIPSQTGCLLLPRSLTLIPLTWDAWRATPPRPRRRKPRAPCHQGSTEATATSRICRGAPRCISPIM